MHQNSQIHKSRVKEAATLKVPRSTHHFLTAIVKHTKVMKLAFYIHGTQQKKQHDQTLSVTLQNTDSSRSKIRHLRYLNPDGKINWITALLPT